MPKRVDHEQRRRQIAEALLRTAAARGLHATGMREVAAEAGVSLRLVQYYFGTKEELLLAGMQHLAARFGERAMTRIRQTRQTGGQASPRNVIAAILAEALPADDERRTFAVLNTAYFALSLTDPALTVASLVKNTNAVIDVIADQLRAAQAADDAPTGLNPDAEALGLLAMSSGLANSVLAGQSSAEQAQAVIDYHLNRLFPRPRPALCPDLASLETSTPFPSRVRLCRESAGRRRGVAWVSDGRVPDAGRVWLELSDLAAQTGLLPVLSDLGAESFAYHGDVAAVGWLTTEAWDPPLHLSAVLRSWEDRFGARLLQIGPGAEIRLLVSRPPRTQDAALAVAAELWAFGDTAWVTYSSQDQVESVADIASLIIDQPIWGFWWD